MVLEKNTAADNVLFLIIQYNHLVRTVRSNNFSIFNSYLIVL